VFQGRVAEGRREGGGKGHKEERGEEASGGNMRKVGRREAQVEGADEVGEEGLHSVKEDGEGEAVVVGRVGGSCYAFLE
jgi:hypothetical protein